MDVNKFREKIFAIKNESDFTSLALELFHYQSEHVDVYGNFLKLLKFKSRNLKSVSEIPFLPVQLFKTHIITDRSSTPEFYFTSSGTTGQVVSKHYVADIKVYEESLLEGFRLFYGDPAQYCFLALLPSYLERSGSSLVYMANILIQRSHHSDSGFYLDNISDLFQKIEILKKRKVKIFLLGVTYALLDLFEKYPMHLPDAVIMETGGMKGKRKEMIRPELHKNLIKGSGCSVIHSEYGMTELFSQAYAQDKGMFKCPPWMKIEIRDIHDPFQALTQGQTGIINIVDLANIHSCAFIASQDIGRASQFGKFEVLGRMDTSELRGCNLMIG